MDTPREVHLKIGRQNYSIRTSLDDDSLERVRILIDEAYGRPVKGMEQEDLLVLTCLQLAYSLDIVGGKLQALSDRLDEALRLHGRHPESE